MAGSSRTSKQHRFSMRTFFIIGVVALPSAFLLMSVMGSKRTRPWFVADLNNLQTIAIGYEIYAEDNHGKLPSHVGELKESEILDDWAFVSRHDPSGNIKPIIYEAQPRDWYSYGSYRFYPTRGLNLEMIKEPDNLVLGYCPLFKQGFQGNDYPTVFFDGRTEMLSKDQLFKLIQAQHP